MVTPTSPTVAFKLGERTADPLAMYLSDYFTVPMPLAGIPAVSIPCGLSEGLPVGFQIAGPAFCESAHPRRRARARAGDRLRGGAARRERGARVRAGDRHRDPRAAAHADEDVLRLRAVVRRASRTRSPARSASRHPGTLPVTNAEAVHFGADDRDGASSCEIAAAVDLPPQELLLSRQPEGLPDQPVRHPALHAAGASATCASTACTWRRTRPSSCTPAARAASTAPRRASSTSTAAARRSWRS